MRDRAGCAERAGRVPDGRAQVYWPQRLWWLALSLWLAACAQLPSQDALNADERTRVPPGYYLVRKGDTLHAIAWRYQLDYRDLALWNGIRDPDRIYVGQRLRLSRPRGETLAQSPARRTPAALREGRAAPRNGASVARSGPAGGYDAITWTWPARGQLVRSFSMTEPGKKGLDIAGHPGQPVHAAAAGKVVYSGDGLLGYGPMVIIKHNDTFLSAYAYNETLLVREGEQVALGQRIAEMGTNGTDRGMLHFEIRRHGRPVDPMLYLPARP